MIVRPRFHAFLLVCVLALTGCTSLEGTGDKGFVSAEGQIVRNAVDERGEPVALEGEDLAGRELSLEEFRGKPVVVVVWGSWCGPCRAEVGDVVAAAQQLGDDAQFVGVNIRDSNQAQAQAFVRTNDVPYPSFYSPDGRAMLAFEGTLTPNSIPSFVLLDEQGRVAASIRGLLPSTTTLVQLTRDVMSGTRADG